MRTKEEQPITAVLRQAGLRASFDAFLLNQTFVLRMNFCAKNPARTQSRRTLAVIQ